MPLAARAARRKGHRPGKRIDVPALPIAEILRRSSERAAAPAAQRHAADEAADHAGAAAAPQKAVQPIRDGSLVKLHSADKKFDGQVGRVVATNVKFAHTQAGLVSVLLAPKGQAQGVWVAVPPECLTVQ